MKTFQQEEENELRLILSGLLVLAWLVTIPLAASAGQGTVAFKPGKLKAAVAKGETVLLHYKSTW